MVDVSSPNWPLQVISRLLNEGMVEHEPECDGIGDDDPDEDCDCIVDDHGVGGDFFRGTRR